MNTDAEIFRNKGIHTPTEDTQSHLADSTATGTLEYSEILGITKQMHERTTAQAALAHEQSKKLENKLSEMTKKLDKVTHVMEEQQLKFTYSNKARELRVDSETEKVDQTREIQNVTNTSVSYDNLENSISGETTILGPHRHRRCVNESPRSNQLCGHNTGVSQLDSRGENGLQVYTHERENANHGFDSTNGLSFSVDAQQ